MGRRANNEGTVYRWGASKSPKTAFRAERTVTLPTGEVKKVTRTGPTASTAVKKREAAIKDLMGRTPSGETVTLTAMFAKLETHKKMMGKKRKTIYNDVRDYNKHIRPYLGERSLTSLTLEDLQSVQYRCIEAGHYRTAELVTIILGSIFKHAMKVYRKEIQAGRLHLTNIAADLDQVERPAKAKPKPPVLWTEEQLAAFLRTSKEQYEARVTSNLHPYFYTAISAGLRRGELMGLRWPSVRQNNGTHYLDIVEQYVYYESRHNHDTPKSDSSIRKVPIGSLLVDVLMAHRERLEQIKARNPDWQEHDLVFPSYNGTPLQPARIYAYFYRITDALELPRTVPHSLRKVYTSYVTRELIRQGRYSPKLVMELLGHSDTKVALDIYTLVIQEDKEAAVVDLDFSSKEGEEG